ncbi:AI-2E family transporter, partial [Oribacterium sinus]
MNWKDLWNKKYLMISVYVLLTALLYHLGSRLVDHLERIPSLWTRHFSWLSQVTSPLLLGFALAYLFSPLCSLLERVLGKIPLFQKKEKLRRNLGILLCYLLILLSLVLLASLFVSVLTKNIQLIQGEDFAKGLESVLLLLKSFYEDLNQRVSEIPIAGNDLQEGIRTFLAKLLSFVQNLGSNFISSVGNMGSLIGTLLFGIIFSIYFLADGVKIALYWERIFRLILGEKRVLAFRGFLKDADRAFSGYIRGQMIDGIIMAILVSFSLSLIGVRYAV